MSLKGFEALVSLCWAKEKQGRWLLHCVRDVVKRTEYVELCGWTEEPCSGAIPGCANTGLVGSATERGGTGGNSA